MIFSLDNKPDLCFDLLSYYINLDILLTAIDDQAKKRINQLLGKVQLIEKPWANAILQSSANDEANRFIINNKVPSLEDILITGQSPLNKYFTIERAFFFKGLAEAAEKQEQGLKSSLA